MSTKKFINAPDDLVAELLEVLIDANELGLQLADQLRGDLHRGAALVVGRQPDDAAPVSEFVAPVPVLPLFLDLPQALAHSVEIAGRCSFALDDLRYAYPAEAVPPG